MISQAIMDFFRDIIVSWISGITTLFDPASAEAAGAAIGGAGAVSSRILWLVFDPGLFGVAVALFGSYLTVWLVTALIAVFGRRGTG